MIDAVLGRVLGLWMSTRAGRDFDRPQRGTAVQVHATGPDADRILLVIDRPSVGTGLLSQELGLAGHLARQLSAQSGRGTDIDVIANGNLTAAECALALSSVDLARFDAVVLMVGASEALALVRPREWVAGLDQLLDDVDAEAPHRVHVFVVEVPPVRALLAFPRVFAVLVQSRIGQLNAATEAACARRSGVTVLPFALPGVTLDGRNSSKAFGIWASFIAPRMRAQLDDVSVVSRENEIDNEPERQRALDDLQVLETSPDPVIDEIVSTAHNLFGTTAAALTFLDHDRRWVKSAVGTTMADSPRLGSLCDLAIGQPGIFVIENISQSVYRAPAVDDEDLTEFYAGYPIETPNGRRIGVLCIMDPEARQFSSSDASLLRDLAIQAQHELWDRNPLTTL